MKVEQASRIVAQVAMLYEPALVLHMTNALMRCDLTDDPEEFDRLFDIGRALGAMMEKERQDTDAWFGAPEYGRPDSIQNPVRSLVNGLAAGRVTLLQTGKSQWINGLHFFIDNAVTCGVRFTQRRFIQRRHERRRSKLEQSRCQNCDSIWEEQDLKPIQDIFQRVDPGEPMPSGECPECGCLCQPFPKGRKLTLTTLEFYDLMAALRDAADVYQKTRQAKTLTRVEGLIQELLAQSESQSKPRRQR